MSATDHATWTHDNGEYTMTFERIIHRPIAAVWSALTEPNQLAKWFYPFQGTLAEGETERLPVQHRGDAAKAIMAPPDC